MLNMFKNKKQFIIGFLSATILLGIIPASAAVKQYMLKQSDYKLVVEGKMYSSKPVLKDDKEENYIPLSATENLNVIISTNTKSKTVSINSVNTTDSAIDTEPNSLDDIKHTSFNNYKDAIIYNDEYYINSKELGNKYKLIISMTDNTMKFYFKNSKETKTINITNSDCIRIKKDVYIKITLVNKLLA